MLSPTITKLYLYPESIVKLRHGNNRLAILEHLPQLVRNQLQNETSKKWRRKPSLLTISSKCEHGCRAICGWRFNFRNFRHFSTNHWDQRQVHIERKSCRTEKSFISEMSSLSKKFSRLQCSFKSCKCKKKDAIFFYFLDATRRNICTKRCQNLSDIFVVLSYSFWICLILQSVHNRGGEYHCNKCHFKSRCGSILKNHDKHMHRTCPNCKKVFSQLERHIKSCNKKMSESRPANSSQQNGSGW